MSPDVGTLDEEALQAALAEDPDAALVLLADLVTATDEGLRGAARRLAGRLVLERARRGRPRPGGAGRMRPVPADVAGDLDLDASAEALLGARAAGRAPDLRELTARTWGRPDTALCLLVDRSGSMNGARLATAALLAAAVALRAPREHAVLAFSRTVDVLRQLDGARSPEAVVDDVLALRGHGTTDLARALRGAADQLHRARAARHVTVLLSDCRVTDGEDPRRAAAGLAELLVLAPEGDSAQAQVLAEQVSARWAVLPGVAAAPAVLAELLG